VCKRAAAVAVGTERFHTVLNEEVPEVEMALV
jgi:hypothetical protein